MNIGSLGNAPFPEPSVLARSVAAAALPAPLDVAPSREWTMREAILVVALAARIHGTPKAIRVAAIRMYKLVTDPQREALLMISESHDPLRLVPLILIEIEVMTPEEMHHALLVSNEFQKIAKLLGLPDDAPLNSVADRVAALLGSEAEAYALQDQVAGLQSLMAEVEPVKTPVKKVSAKKAPVKKTSVKKAPAKKTAAPVESDFDMGKRLRNEGKALSDLWSISEAAGASFDGVLAGYTATGDAA